MNRKYNFVYKITNNINGDYYYGVHSTDNLNDGYMGSGLRINNSINKYGKENFTREIVQFFSRKKCAYSLESAIVTRELINDEHCLNIALGGKCGFTIDLLTQEEREQYCYNMSLAVKGEKNGFYGKKHSDATRKILSEYASKRTGEKNSFYGKHHTEESNERNRQAHMGKHHSEEARQKMSESQKKRKGKDAAFFGHHHTKENIEVFRKHSLNRKFINNGQITKFVKESELDIFLNKGWKLGRIKKKK